MSESSRWDGKENLEQLTATFSHDQSEAKRTVKITTYNHKPFKTHITFSSSFSPSSPSTLPQLSKKKPTEQEKAEAKGWAKRQENEEGQLIAGANVLRLPERVRR